MKQNAVRCPAIVLALAAATTGGALCAAPAGAQVQQTQMALAPLSKVLAQPSVFTPRRIPAGPMKTALKSVERGGMQDGDCNDDWENHRVRLQNLPLGYTVASGMSLANLIPNHPAGFPADNYSYYLTPVMGMGGGLEFGLSLVGAQALGPLGQAMFYGASAQKQLTSEVGWLPAISVGVRGNFGPNGQRTGAAYVVGTKKIIGHACGSTGVYVTGGFKSEVYDTDRRLAAQTPAGERVPGQDGNGIRPFGGLNIALSRRIFASAEISKRMPWEFDNPFCVKGTVLVFKDWGVSGGVENVGYKTHGFIDLVLGSFGGSGRR